MEEFSSTLIPQLVSLDKKIGVLCGGMSNEREVSLRSGKNCLSALHRLGYKDAELIDVDKDIAKNLHNKKIDIAYIALHGKYGEDGCVQGMLEILGIPYTGCGVRASAVSMHKECTKRVLEANGIPLIKSVLVTEPTQSVNLKYPLMAKPVSEGSSIGMTKVESNNELKNAIEVALECNSEVMLEEYVQGKSITVGVLDLQDKTIATPILEFRTKTEWYDFEAKYTEGLTEFIIPGEFSDELTKEIQEFSIMSHKAVGASGMSRVDFLVDENNKPYVLEINTIPGMTDLSDLPAQANSMGIDYDNLVKIILNSATLEKN